MSGPPGRSLRDAGTTAVDPLPAPSTAQRRRKAAVPAALVSLALLGVNGLAYVMTVVAARALAPEAFGELAALLGVMFIGVVPATALQTAAALTLGANPADRPAVMARLHTTTWAGAAGVGVLGLASVGPLVTLLHLSGPSTVLWLTAVLVPHTLVGGYDGLLQGNRRYGRLALVNTTFGVLKSGGGITGLIVGGTPEAALVGMAAGCAASAVVGWWFSGRPGFAGGIRGHVVAAAKASGALLGLVLMVNLDLLLARHHLPAGLAGEYAVASIFAKVAFWLPQGVSVVLLPRLANARGRRRLLPVAAALVAVVGAVLTAATAVLGARALPLVGGAEYGDALGGATWVFAMLGTLFALAQLLLYSGIAASDRIAAVAVWCAVALEAAAVEALAARDGLTVLTIAGIAVGASVLLVGTGLLRLWRTHAREGLELRAAAAR
ncbi:lipopolysaccharide biosynthesis protein [Blastococcus sp. SYSU D01042]